MIKSITGKIVCQKHKSDCACCEGNFHVFSTYLKLPNRKKEHHHLIDNWIQDKIDFKANEGKKIKITIELED